MKRVSNVFWALALVLTASCVTINIYFPASAAEKVADEIIEDVQQPAKPAAEPQSMRLDTEQTGMAAWVKVLNWVIPAAQAAEADLSADSPAIHKIQAAMKSRFPALSAYYDQGVVGQSSDGLVKVRDANAVPLKDRGLVNKLVAAENADRNALYRAIADANGHPEWEVDIRETFARRWVANARAGWWVESGSGWRQK